MCSFTQLIAQICQKTKNKTNKRKNKNKILRQRLRKQTLPPTMHPLKMHKMPRSKHRQTLLRKPLMT